MRSSRDPRRAKSRSSPPRRIPRRPENSPARGVGAKSSSSDLSNALKDAKAEDNNLLSPVHVPEDPNGVINEGHPAATILANSAIVVQRQLEMMNVMMGFEQANKYVIMDGQGQHIGYMAEQEFGMGNMLAKQTFRTHRSFTTHVFDKHQREVLRVGPDITRKAQYNTDRPSFTAHFRIFPRVSESMILWRSPLNHVRPLQVSKLQLLDLYLLI